MKQGLNLGCGMTPGGGCINHDRIKHSSWIDVAWDLNKIPWPWEDNSISRIIARSVLEHLRLSLIESVNECWRIVVPAGRLFLKLPAWNSSISHQDPTHRWFFDPRVFEYFDPTTPLGKQYSFYTPYKWKLVNPGKPNKGGSSIHATLQKVDNV